VPANEFVNLAELGTEGNISDYQEIQQNGPERDALHEFHWLPTRHGALLKTLPVHEPNDSDGRSPSSPLRFLAPGSTGSF
jgi:hypothetical protein